MSASVVLDSVAPHGARLTTLECTLPRPFLAELNTHRNQSKNSESSRAVPPETRISMVISEPWVPDFGERVKGMGQGDRLSGTRLIAAERAWRDGATYAANVAEELLVLGVDKSHVNRILEPYLWHTVILSATTWRNFLGLRCPPGDEVDYNFPAAPEMQVLALEIRDALRASVPQTLDFGEWHAPYTDGRTYEHALESAGRCATISYARVRTDQAAEEAITRTTTRLIPQRHWSPLEHPAAVMLNLFQRSGNFTGFRQLRSYFPHQANAAADRADLVDIW